MQAIHVRLLAGLVGPCPTCGSGSLQPVFDGEILNFRCQTCAGCWHPDRGGVARVDASSCPGCQFRATCAAAAAEVSPGERRQRGHAERAPDREAATALAGQRRPASAC
jgi:hypothetical protein